ncbi:hypothetical protein LCGC14_1540530 [marine sediment metagenome]|uniref:Uncharacterized protein n=1 Tax=marine sediment metagenome TaxID=412755 RepID=A0A0F9LTY1_9ZZZZ
MVRLSVRQKEELLRGVSTDTLERMVLQGESRAKVGGINQRLALLEGRQRKRRVLQRASRK